MDTFLMTGLSINEVIPFLSIFLTYVILKSEYANNTRKHEQKYMFELITLSVDKVGNKFQVIFFINMCIRNEYPSQNLLLRRKESS